MFISKKKKYSFFNSKYCVFGVISRRFFCSTLLRNRFLVFESIMEQLKLESSAKSFGGFQKVYSHDSKELECRMKFAIYLPPQAEDGVKLPVLYFLSGLTCTEQNFITKSGFQKYAADHGLVVVAPDTSPRGVPIEGDSVSYDFGVGAGFYLDAKSEPWKKNYRMGSYITKELFQLIADAFGNVDVDNAGVFGHSMGGHGALISSLRNPGLFKSVSAFAPICNPMACPWGKKAFNGYLGTQESANWEQWDATKLVAKYNGPPLAFLIDQGTADLFYIEKQLLPENLVEACRDNQFPVILKMREGYDHSYFYISTYIGEHIEYHANILKAKS